MSGRSRRLAVLITFAVPLAFAPCAMAAGSEPTVGVASATNVDQGLAQSLPSALLELTCTGTGTCAGKLTLTVKGSTTDKGKASKTKTTTTTIGTASFSIPPGKTATVELTLNRTSRALLGIDHGRMSASLTILKSSPAPSQTHAENVHLVQQKMTKRKGGK